MEPEAVGSALVPWSPTRRTSPTAGRSEGGRVRRRRPGTADADPGWARPGRPRRESRRRHAVRDGGCLRRCQRARDPRGAGPRSRSGGCRWLAGRSFGPQDPGDVGAAEGAVVEGEEREHALGARGDGDRDTGLGELERAQEQQPPRCFGSVTDAACTQCVAADRFGRAPCGEEERAVVTAFGVPARRHPSVTAASPIRSPSASCPAATIRSIHAESTRHASSADPTTVVAGASDGGPPPSVIRSLSPPGARTRPRRGRRRPPWDPAHSRSRVGSLPGGGHRSVTGTSPGRTGRRVDRR